MDITLPKVPFVGMTFIPYGTNSVGTVLSIKSKRVDGSPNVNISGSYNGNIEYSYAHDPKNVFVEPYQDVRKFAHEPMPIPAPDELALRDAYKGGWQFAKPSAKRSAKIALNIAYGKVATQ